jgi:hypothetical protein
MRCEQACSEGLQLTQGVLATATTLGHNNEAVITAAILLALNDLMQRIMPKCFSRAKSAMLRGLLVRRRSEACRSKCAKPFGHTLPCKMQWGH